MTIFSPRTSAQGDALEAAVRNLARRTAAMIEGTRVSCVGWENRAGLSDARSLQLSSAFLSEIPGAAPNRPEDPKTCGVRVLLDRTPTRVVLSAQVLLENDRVAISQIPRDEVSSPANPSAKFSLQKELLLEQRERILDAQQLPATQNRPNSLLILSRESVTLFWKGAGVWKAHRSWPASSVGTDRRAPRGELALVPDRPGTVKIFLSGRSCTLDLESEAAPVCENASAPWRTRAIVSSACDGTTRELKTSSADWVSSDRISLIDASSKVDTQSGELSTPGPVFSISDAASPQTGATAVVFNLASGTYEIYAITLDCSE